jgi:hypothetical protein
MRVFNAGACLCNAVFHRRQAQCRFRLARRIVEQVDIGIAAGSRRKKACKSCHRLHILLHVSFDAEMQGWKIRSCAIAGKRRMPGSRQARMMHLVGGTEFHSFRPRPSVAAR